MKLLSIERQGVTEAENDADRVAADWVAHLDRIGGEEADHPELARWLAADMRHRGAFARAQAAWMILDSGRGLVAPRTTRERPPLVSRRAAITGIAASAVVVSAGAAFIALPGQAQAKTFSTVIGEIKRFRLDDGSIMVLDTDSRVETRIDAARREARLIAGGAWFEVVDNPRLPFVAQSRDAFMLGQAAAFEFRVTPRSEVLVSGGQLSLKRRAGKGDEYRLKKGARAVFEPDGVVQIETVPQGAIPRLLAWREGGLNLDGESVAYAAEQLNSYNTRKLVIADPRIAGEALVGRFEVNKPQDFAEAVALSFEADIRYVDDTIRIEARKKID